MPISPPTIISPANNTAFPETTTQVTLTWSAVPGAGTYTVIVDDLTEPSLRHPGNNCPDNLYYFCRNNLTQTAIVVNVQPRHAYRWSVQKVSTQEVSAPAVAQFRVGEADAAELVSQHIPEIIEPGTSLVAVVTMRNVGSTTWTPGAGYKLGSANPQDNMTWGLNRVDMVGTVSVPPGGAYTFNFSITAPHSDGVPNCQWRMVREGVRWFGKPSENRWVHVKDRTDSQMRVKRNMYGGLLIDNIGQTVMLRGGHYHLFEHDSRGDQKLVYDGSHNNSTILVDYGPNIPCAPMNTDNSKLTPWPNDSWTTLLNTVRTNDITLLRAFLTNGAGIRVNAGGTAEEADDIYPFKGVAVTVPNDSIKRWRWKIKDAVENPNDASKWNQAYYDRLKAFADKFYPWTFLQISLFNYYDLVGDVTTPPWSDSIWNAKRSFDANWAETHLFPESLGAGQRQLQFIKPLATSQLRSVQEAMVRKLVRELYGKQNIIFEVMNEPHQGSQQEVAEFSSAVIEWILDEAKKYREQMPDQRPEWRPLISINASRPAGGRHDVDWWQEHSSPAVAGYVPHYEDVDIISYHGLTGLDGGTADLCNHADVPLPAVDRHSVAARLDGFSKKHYAKALMMSTDAVQVGVFEHKYPINNSNLKNSMNLRDGQITTGLGNMEGNDLEQRKRADLENWAFWCFASARPMGQVIHFQNHSTYEATYAKINKAYRDSLMGGD